MILRYKTKAVETLDLTIAEQQEPGEYKPKLFKGEQRKLYRDDITPLTDEEKKALRQNLIGIGDVLFFIIITAAAIGSLFLYYKADFNAAYQCSSMIFIGMAVCFLFYWHGNGDTRRELAADRKRIIIAPVLRLAKVTEGTYKSRRKFILTTLETKDEIKGKVPGISVDWKERDMVEMHLIFRPDGSTRIALEPTKVVAFKRGKQEPKDLQRQVFFKDEIVPLTDEDRKKIKKKVGFAKGCAVFFAAPAAFAIYWFFFSANETMWRFVFGGIGASAAVLLVLAWLLLSWGNNDELKNNKKRVIVAPVVELFKKTILGKPTKFFATIKTGAEILEQEISVESFLDLKANDIIELQLSENPGGTPTVLQEITKIADPILEQFADTGN